MYYGHACRENDGLITQVVTVHRVAFVAEIELRDQNLVRTIGNAVVGTPKEVRARKLVTYCM